METDEMTWRETLEKYFSGAIMGKEFTEKVFRYLDSQEGFTSQNTIFGNSTCPDEINREVTAFESHYGENFPMGGLAGYPFAGISGFNAFAHHAPNMSGVSNLLILYGPHIGIDEHGHLGMIKRKGMNKCTTACGSAVGAFNLFKESWEKGLVDVPLFDGLDQQQYWIRTVLLAHMKKILESEEPMKEIVDTMWITVDEAVRQIATSNRTHFAGRIALIGGVQINTPIGEPSYFLPKRFELFDKRSGETKDCMGRLQ